jgi:hypothetical protein
MAGALLTAPLPTHAAQTGSCQPAPASRGSVVGYAYIATPLNQGQTGVRGLFALQLTVKIARNGSAQADGAIHIADDPAAAALSPYVPMLVIAKNVVGVTCADLDEDGRRGLSRLEADAEIVATGERVRVVLTPTEHDVDAAGVYSVALQIGDTTVTGETRFRIVDDAPPRKGRRSR